MSTADDDQNPYELLGVTLESTEAEIRKAYRQRSLKVHPDRNPNNRDAARLFHELNQAYELLLDPLRRLAIDATLRVKAARKARFSTFDGKRKAMQEELEERERAFNKKAKMEKRDEEVKVWHETERIKEEGRRMREEREKEAARKLAEAEVAKKAGDDTEDDAVPKLGHLDTTVRLKYPLASHPTLTTAAALSSYLTSFGPTDSTSIVLSMKPPKKAPHKPAKTGTALVPFKQIGDAFAAVCASGRDGIEIAWAEGKEPEILTWLKKNGKLGSSVGSTPPLTQPVPSQTNSPIHPPFIVPTTSTSTSASPFSSFPASFPSATSPAPSTNLPDVPGLDYESLTLMRMRQAERERLEREIREAEAND